MAGAENVARRPAVADEAPSVGQGEIDTLMRRFFEQGRGENAEAGSAAGSTRTSSSATSRARRTRGTTTTRC